jgi:hypothetical protein
MYRSATRIVSIDKQEELIQTTTTTSSSSSFAKQPTRIDGEPTYEKIAELRQTLMTNAASIHCKLGGGQHGYLAFNCIRHNLCIHQ